MISAVSNTIKMLIFLRIDNFIVFIISLTKIDKARLRGKCQRSSTFLNSKIHSNFTGNCRSNFRANLVPNAVFSSIPEERVWYQEPLLTIRHFGCSTKRSNMSIIKLQLTILSSNLFLVKTICLTYFWSY